MLRYIFALACVAAVVQSAKALQPDTNKPLEPMNQPVVLKPQWEIGLAALTLAQQSYPGAASQAKQSIVIPTAIYRSKTFNMDDNGR